MYSNSSMDISLSSQWYNDTFGDMITDSNYKEMCLVF